jgi:transcription initiation factor TFIID subunit 5
MWRRHQKTTKTHTTYCELPLSPRAADMSQVASDIQALLSTLKVTEALRVTAERAAEQDQQLYDFCARTLDVFRDELLPLAYALFVHVHLSLADREQDAARFLSVRAKDHKAGHAEDIATLFALCDKAAVEASAWAQRVLHNKFRLRLSRFAAEALIAFMFDQKLVYALTLLARHVELEIAEAAPRLLRASTLTDRLLADADAAKLIAADGATLEGNAKPIPLRVPLRARNPYLLDASADDLASQDLPPLADAFWKDYCAFVPEFPPPVPPGAGSSGSPNWPSIALMSFLNASDGLICVTSSADDAKLVAAGFEDSRVRVWQAQAGGEPMGRRSEALVGHKGPVYGVSLWNREPRVISCSADGSSRLWIQDPAALPPHDKPWRHVAAYEAKAAAEGKRALWDVKFAPHGFYFATAGQDHACRLWNCETGHELRSFEAHLSDISCVDWHPNVHYLASGSDDKTCVCCEEERGRAGD